MKKTLILLICMCFIISCNESELQYEPIDLRDTAEGKGRDKNFILKEEFGKALAKVLFKSKEARTLIKNEALKKINYDYDVLYLLVKDMPLSDNNTLEGLLGEYLTSNRLEMIVAEIPNLTIFVPSLPLNTFSAELWDTENDIPVVGIRTNTSNNIAIYDELGNIDILEAQYAPAFPVVVIKENERIVATKKNNQTKSVRSGVNLAFIDDCFNNSDQALKSSVTHNGKPIADKISKVVEAYDIYNGTDGWQRDYVYYDLKPTNTKGTFKLNYKEHIVAFELLGNAHTVYNKIADQTGDPTIYVKPGDALQASSTGSTGWTDGEFEFMVKIYVGAKSAFGSEIITYFRAAPKDLFNMNWESVGGGGRGRGSVKYNGNLTTLKMNKIDLPLFEWNLSNFGESIKIAIEEVDSDQTTEQTSSTTVEFATNFEWSESLGTEQKVGLKFGGSKKETRSVAYKVTTKLGSDQLGEVIINFGDPIIISRNFFDVLTDPGRPSYGGTPITAHELADFNKKYSTGWYRLYIAPLKTN